MTFWVRVSFYDGAAVAVSMEKDNLKTATEKKSLSDRLFSLGYDAQKVFARSVMSGIEIMGNFFREEIIAKERERFQSTIDRLSARGDKDTLKMLTVVLENDKNTRIGTFQSLVNDGISIENVVYRMHADKDVLHFFKLFSRVEEEHKKTAIAQIFEYMGIDDIEMPNRNEIFR